MRIARVLTRLNLGGPARQVLASDPLLLARGHQMRVFAGHPAVGEGDLFEEVRAAGVEIVRLAHMSPGVAPIADLLARRQLVRELVAFAPDVVHTHASKAGWIGRRAARSVPKAARVHTFHGHVLEGYFPEPVARRLVALETKLARETQRIVAVSHATAADLVRLGVVEEARLQVIPPGVDLAPFTALEPRRLRGPASGPLRRELGAGADDVLVGAVGRLAPVKQPDLALGAFALLATRYPKLHLVFVGDGGERRALERAVLALPEPARARAHMLGARTDMPALYAELDAVLLSSRSEGLPVALIEAGAAALPAVAFAVGGVDEVLVHERTGLLVEPKDGVDGLAFALAQLLEDPRAAEAMGERARVRVVARHGAAALADRLETLYCDVAEGTR